MTIMMAKFVDILFDRSLTAKLLKVYNNNVYYYKLFLRPILPSQNLGYGGRQYYVEDYLTLTENSTIRSKYYQHFLAQFEPSDPRTPEHAIH